MSQKYLTVSQLTRYLSYKFERDPYLQTVYLTGEITNFDRNNPNRHQYFTLKDDQAQIPVVMFQSDFKKVKFKPKHGDKVLVIGRVQLYQPHGKYQMVIQHMEPDGIGQLYKLLEQTKEKLQTEGLFDFERKPIPAFPKRIAVVTSSSGAVIHDIILNVKKRFPIVQLVLYPTVVQGEFAATSIAKNITLADQRGDFDTIILGRGGGSFEDLFAFNEEAVVRAVSACQTPVISSIGHETDTSLTDLVSDYRASTPTEAAVVATPVLEEVVERVHLDRQRLNLAFQNKYQQVKKRLELLVGSYVLSQPQRLYEQNAQRLDLAERDLNSQMTHFVNGLKHGFKHLDWRMNHISLAEKLKTAAENKFDLDRKLHQTIQLLIDQDKQKASQSIQALDLLSPLRTLARGYSVTSSQGRIIKSIDQVQKQDLLDIHLVDGQIKARVEDIKKKDDE